SIAPTCSALRDELIGGLRALPEKVFFTLRHPQALSALARHVQPVLVDEHLRVLEPFPPSLLGDVRVETFAELTLERGLVEPLRLVTELDAIDQMRHGFAAEHSLERASSQPG